MVMVGSWCCVIVSFVLRFIIYFVLVWVSGFLGSGNVFGIIVMYVVNFLFYFVIFVLIYFVRNIKMGLFFVLFRMGSFIVVSMI